MLFHPTPGRRAILMDTEHVIMVYFTPGFERGQCNGLQD